MRDILGVDPAAATPIWRQIEDGMRRLVASGRLTAGAAVPSVRDLARELGVNPATVAKAYRRLIEGGQLEVRRGEGTYVAERSASEAAAERRALLAEGARSFVRLARHVGVTREEASGVLDRVWNEREGDEP